MKHNYIGGEHLLLGLFHDEKSVAALTLNALGATLPAARERVVHVIGRGEDPVATGQIPFTPRAKKMLELALREALSMGHNYIGTEHILLGVTRESEGVAAQILFGDLDLTQQKIRDEVIDRLLGKPRRPGDLAVTISRPPIEVPSDDGIWRKWRDGPRTTVTIEGLNECVQPYIDAIQALLDAEDSGSARASNG